MHRDFGSGNGPVPVDRANLADYDPDDQEPDGLEITVVDSGEKMELDEALLGRWLAETMELHLNGQVRLLHCDTGYVSTAVLVGEPMVQLHEWRTFITAGRVLANSMATAPTCLIVHLLYSLTVRVLDTGTTVVQ